MTSMDLKDFSDVEGNTVRTLNCLRDELEAPIVHHFFLQLYSLQALVANSNVL